MGRVPVVTAVGVARVMVVSDTHLSVRAPEAEANWATVARYATETAVELVVHVGDLTLNAVHDPSELVRARRLLDGLAVPWVAVPGNHDIGDNPYPGSPEGSSIDQERLDGWRRAVGPDRWSVDIGGWTLVGINAQLFASGLASEAAQRAWLVKRFASIPVDRPTVLITHKPLSASGTELAAAPVYRFLPSTARRQLDELFRGHRVPLVLSGHVHQSRTLSDDERRHVWVPTTWAVLPNNVQATLGSKRCGVTTLALFGDGRAHTELVEPPGIAQLTLSRDIPDPYGH